MWRGLISATAGGVDRVVHRAATRLVSRGRVRALDADARVAGLQAILEEQRGWPADDAVLFPAHAGPTWSVALGADQPGVTAEEWRWRSEVTPLHRDLRPDTGRHAANAEGVARTWRTGVTGAPAVVLLHGYLCGQWSVEQRLWPVEAFLRWGLDVTLVVLPHHGARSTGLGPPAFPSADPRWTVEGMRQAVADVRAVVTRLRQGGARHVGLMGMSLGGYVAALAASVVDVDFLAPMIPLACMADFARESGQLGEDVHARAEQHHLLREVHARFSPLGRARRLSGGRVLVMAAHGDRVTPVSHSERLALHLDAPLHLFHGGHVLQAGRAQAFRALRTLLRREHIIDG